MLRGRGDEHIYLSAERQSPKTDIEICICLLGLALDIYITMTLLNAVDQLGILVASINIALCQEQLFAKFKFFMGGGKDNMAVWCGMKQGQITTQITHFKIHKK